jgi:hypothetical protein
MKIFFLHQSILGAIANSIFIKKQLQEITTEQLRWKKDLGNI